MNAQHPDLALPEENGSEIVPDSDSIGLRSVPLDRVLQETADYASGQLAELGADTLLRRKFGYAFWRSRITRQLVERIVASPAAQHEPLMLALAALHTYLAPEALNRLHSIVAPELFAGLQCAQGIRPAVRAGGRLAGPQIDLKISANRSSRWTFEKWARIEELGRYDFEEDGVRFRGVLLRPGDVLLSNCNLDGNGIYTTLGDPKAYSSHAALFAILSAGDRRFPAAIETYEKGVRPTPLNVFLSPRYAAHTEVYRHVNLATEHTVQVNEAAARMIREVKGYNFDTCDSARDYVSCTGVPRFVLQDAGLDPGCTKSNILDSGIQQNLLELGYDFFGFSSPIDFVLSDEYRCVGWFDNDQVDKLVARELVEVEFRQRFAAGRIDARRFPLAYWLNRFGIREMRRRSVAGRVITAVEGFDHVSLPKGPDALLALIKPAEQQIGRAIGRVYPVVRRHLMSVTKLDLGEIRAAPEIQATVTAALRVPWLTPRR